MVEGQKQVARTSWWSFGGMTGAGLLIAFLIFAIFGIGECLPRNGSVEMQICDAGKRRFFWLYPTTVVSIVIAGVWLHAIGIKWARALALFSGLTAIAALAFLSSLVG